MAKDLAEDYPSTRWGIRNDPMRLGLALYAEALDRITGAVIGVAKGDVSLLPLGIGGDGLRSVGDAVRKEVERMVALLPSGL